MPTFRNRFALANASVNERAKLLKFPYRCDFSRLTGMFQSAYAKENGIVPPATTLPQYMQRGLIEHEFDQDHHAQPLTWRSTLEFVSSRRRSHTTNFVTFRVANDGFVYLDPKSACASAIAATYAVESDPSIPRTAGDRVASPLSISAMPSFMNIMRSTPYPFARSGFLNRRPLNGWFQLQENTISHGALAPMKTAFCDWITIWRNVATSRPSSTTMPNTVVLTSS
eukprot:m.108277 g.108277  ORF g.108277 m.108277 type:complete len:226 (+) comp9002_c0_seq10:172-849(+)